MAELLEHNKTQTHFRKKINCSLATLNCREGVMLPFQPDLSQILSLFLASNQQTHAHQVSVQQTTQSRQQNPNNKSNH
jgi:hypothetical protein